MIQFCYCEHVIYYPVWHKHVTVYIGNTHEPQINFAMESDIGNWTNAHLKTALSSISSV